MSLGKVLAQADAAWDMSRSASTGFATALAAAGIPVAQDRPLDGVNLLPYLLDQKREAPHESLFWRAGPQHADGVRMSEPEPPRSKPISVSA